jgi:hypothetical protein
LAAVQAEEFSKKTGKTQVVVGWVGLGNTKSSKNH